MPTPGSSSVINLPQNKKQNAFSEFVARSKSTFRYIRLPIAMLISGYMINRRNHQEKIKAHIIPIIGTTNVDIDMMSIIRFSDGLAMIDKVEPHVLRGNWRITALPEARADCNSEK